MATPLPLLRATALPALLGLSLLHTTAAAQPAPSGETPAADPLFAPRPAVRRAGFAAGIAGGLSLGSAAGFPNDIQKIGFQRHYTETGVGIGGGGYVWLGGVLADWLT